MSKQAQLMEMLKKDLRSLLIAAKGGLSPARLEHEYLAMIGKPLPLRDLGFRSTLELVADMPEVVRVCPYKGTFILKAIADESTKGIAELVAKQKSSRSRKSWAARARVASPSLTPQLGRACRQPTTAVAAPAARMTPLELYSEAESFHLTAEVKSEPVETEAVGDGLQQPQDLEQSFPGKLILTADMPPDAVQDRSLCKLPPLERGCLVAVFVSLIISPSQFYIQLCTRDTSGKLQEMMHEMRLLYSHKTVSDRYVLPESSVHPGQLCCVMVLGWWYRAIIHRVINHQEVEVFCTDYGNLKTVQKSDLRLLKWCYLKLPAQAIPCSLAGVQPTQGTWSSAAALQFKELCGSNILVGLVDEYVKGVLHLFLCDTSTKEDVYIHQVLSNRGHAAICKENVPSQGFQELNPLALYVQPSKQKEFLQEE
ncbi:tudor domain-containing protein 5-like isoform X2 [Pogoniulus pusillus]|uniref:tudor domain-containing protein 5-like isoform X2 n=1 Tax=Pogoniulus pusillus TaxID=488313 RepID=UPI0030B93A4D